MLEVGVRDIEAVVRWHRCNGHRPWIQWRRAEAHPSELVRTARLRLRHREALRHIVDEVVRNRQEVESAATRLAAWVDANVEASARACFLEIAETKLLGLHEGNSGLPARFGCQSICSNIQ